MFYQCKIFVENSFNPYTLVDMWVDLKCRVWLDYDCQWVQEGDYVLIILIVYAPSEDIMTMWRHKTESFFTIRSREPLTNFDPYSNPFFGILRRRLEVDLPPERNIYELTPTPDDEVQRIGETGQYQKYAIFTWLAQHNRAVHDKTPLWCWAHWNVKSVSHADLQQLVSLAHHHKIEIYYEFERTQYASQSVYLWVKDVTIPEFESLQETIRQLVPVERWHWRYLETDWPPLLVDKIVLLTDESATILYHQLSQSLGSQ